jgi:uncharacterized protein (DUF433 family)
MAVRAVYRRAAERLPKGVVVRRDGELFLTTVGAICLRLDRDMPKEVPSSVRRLLYGRIGAHGVDRAEVGEGGFRYVVEPKSAAAEVGRFLGDYRKAMALIAEDPEVQGGAATFRGTRLMVHHVADLVAQGTDAAELAEDYPGLTPDMIAAAPIYARTHPRRGRPRKPAWRHATPVSELRRPRATA